MMKLVCFLAAVGAGVAACLQSGANAGLSARASLGAALVVNTIVVLIGCVIFFFATGSPVVFFPPAAPWFVYIGGVCGFLFILANAFVFPRIGAGPAIALLVLGQGAAALAIDHFGLMGLARHPISLSRLAGIILIVGGVVLIRRSA
jgi:transporter family-2 protein